MLIISSFFIVLDVYYALWVLSLKLKLPDYMSKLVVKALLGKADELYKALS